MRERLQRLRWWVGGLRLHDARWVTIDPTGGDPFMGGPVKIQVCSVCGDERPVWDGPVIDRA